MLREIKPEELVDGQVYFVEWERRKYWVKAKLKEIKTSSYFGAYDWIYDCSIEGASDNFSTLSFFKKAREVFYEEEAWFNNCIATGKYTAPPKFVEGNYPIF